MGASQGECREQRRRGEGTSEPGPESGADETLLIVSPRALDAANLLVPVRRALPELSPALRIPAYLLGSGYVPKIEYDLPFPNHSESYFAHVPVDTHSKC